MCTDPRLIPPAYTWASRHTKPESQPPDSSALVTIRNHLLKTAERMEAELGDEKPVFFEGTEDDWEQQPIPDGPMTVGIDGGFVRAAHKPGFLEVIAGKSVLEFRRNDEGQKTSSKCFSFVQTYDQK